MVDNIKKRYSWWSSLAVSLLLHVCIIYGVYLVVIMSDNDFFISRSWCGSNINQIVPPLSRLLSMQDTITWIFEEDKKNDALVNDQDTHVTGNKSVNFSDHNIMTTALIASWYNEKIKKATVANDLSKNEELYSIKNEIKPSERYIQYGLRASQIKNEEGKKTGLKQKRVKRKRPIILKDVEKKTVTLADLTNGFLNTIRVSHDTAMPIILKTEDVHRNDFYMLNMGHYLYQIIKSIENEIYIHPYPSKNLYRLLSVLLHLEIKADGTIVYAEIKRESGDASYDQFIKSIVTKVSPYAPIPKSLKKDTIDFFIDVPILLESALRIRRPFIRLLIPAS